MGAALLSFLPPSVMDLSDTRHIHTSPKPAPPNPQPGSPFPQSKPRGLAALIQMVVETPLERFKLLPGVYMFVSMLKDRPTTTERRNQRLTPKQTNKTEVNHTWVIFGGKEGRDAVRFPSQAPAHDFEARRLGVRVRVLGWLV